MRWTYYARSPHVIVYEEVSERTPPGVPYWSTRHACKVARKWMSERPGHSLPRALAPEGVT